MMFNEVPFLDRFALARQAGFEAVEFLFPYEHPPESIRERLDGCGLRQVLFNAPPGDWAGGERGTASLPDRQAEFRAGIETALRYAAALGCPRLHVMGGIPGPGQSREAARARYVANLAWAAERCQQEGVLVLIEPINRHDMPGYILGSSDEAAAIVEAIGPERIALQYDLYHTQITEGDLTRRAERLLPIIGHMQLADVPHRHEPGTGEIAWDYVLGRIDAMGYRGWIGCEYRPAGETVAGLGWIERFRA
nr:2-oxo-tetronate isomerase [Roseomonas acroporae]